jgi:hypothetical protein
LQVSGYWKTFYTVANNGTPLCGMQSDFGQPGAVEASLMVKYAKGDNYFIVHAFKNSWRIPRGVKIPLYLTFDNSPPYTAIGTGIASNGHSFVQFEIATEFSKGFLDLFAAANAMTLGFSEGTEPPWTLNMTGSREAVASFARCVITIDPPASSSTQPYGNGNRPTQPYGDGVITPKPVPTQPYRAPAKRDNGAI